MLRRAEASRRKRKERANQRARFTSNPFQYVTKLLGNKTSGKLQAPIDEVEEHLKKTHSDNRRNEDLGECERVVSPPEPPEPTTIFDGKEPGWKEMQEIVKRIEQDQHLDQMGYHTRYTSTAISSQKDCGSYSM